MKSNHSKFTPKSKSKIVDSLVSAILVTDTNLNLQYMNLAAEELIGNSFSRIKHQSIQSILSVTDLDAHILQAIETQQSHVVRESKITVRSHHLIQIDCAITALYENELFTGMLFEITQIDRQLRIARGSHLLNTQATNQSVLRGIAHEIKNPLGGLRGAAQLLESELLDQSLTEYTQIIIAEADRLTKLVDKMLGSYSKSDSSSNPPVKKTAVNIHEVLEHCRQVIEANYTSTPASTFRITHDYDPSIPDIHGDKDQLVQVILNLLNNAAKSLSEKGHILIKTRVLRNFTIKQRNHPLVLRAQIIDNGRGVPTELQDRIFFPMISGYADGTGLGLSIAQSLISQHNGLIEFDSKPGKTRFSIIIPITPPPSLGQKNEEQSK